MEEKWIVTISILSVVFWSIGVVFFVATAVPALRRRRIAGFGGKSQPQVDAQAELSTLEQA